MKKNLFIIMFGASIGLLPAARAAETLKTLDRITYSKGEIVLVFSGPVKANAFKILSPPRIVVEFPGVEYNISARAISGDDTIVRRVRGGQFRNEPTKIARIVVELYRTVPYEITTDERTIRIMIGNKPAVVAAAKPVTSPPRAPAKPAEVQPAVKSTPPASASAAIPVQNEKIPMVIAQPAQDTTVVLPPALTVKTAAAPQKTLSAATESAPGQTPAEVPVAPVQPPLPAVHKTVPVPEAGRTTTPSVAFPKKRITVDFEEADIRDVFRILSLKSGINIIYGPDVAGTISLRLEDVPMDQAFDTILAIKGLVSQEQGPKILRIATPLKIAEDRAQAVTFTRIFQLNYAKAEEIKSNLDSIRNAEGRRGNISVDLRTNSLIVTDTPEGLNSLERVIKDLDKKPWQVMIEARIVEVVVSKSMDVGIQWQTAAQIINDHGVNATLGLSKAETSSIASGPGAVEGANRVTPVATIDGGTGLTIPASAVQGQIAAISFGLVTDQVRLSGILSALAQKGLSKLLSNPKVTTINNKEAKILVGQRIPYTTTTVGPAGSTQATSFLDVGVKLTVTPTVNIDQKITLQVHPEVSLYIRADPAGPVIGTREAQTTVLVNNGETVVIGGLITDEDRKLGTKVPLLGDLPIIGHLFKRNYDTKDRTELLVFITPVLSD